MNRPTDNDPRDSTVRDHTFLKNLRRMGLVEGISTLILFGIAMPLKYMADLPMAVRIAGSVHGFLFVCLAVMLLMSITRVPLSRTMALAGVAAAVVPFGSFKIREAVHGSQLSGIIATPTGDVNSYFAPAKDEFCRSFQSASRIASIVFISGRQQTHNATHFRTNPEPEPGVKTAGGVDSDGRPIHCRHDIIDCNHCVCNDLNNVRVSWHVIRFPTTSKVCLLQIWPLGFQRIINVAGAG